MKQLVSFLKNWTLPASMLLGTTLYLLFAMTPALEPAAICLSPLFDQVLPVFMFLILFVTFCKVDFHQMRLSWWHLWVFVIQMLLVLVLLAVVMQTSRPNARILWEGALTCVIAPTASAAAVITVKLGGNLGQMTAYTFLSNFATALLIPIVYPLMEPHATMGFWLAFLLILKRVCMVLVLPLLAGYLVQRFLPRLCRLIVSVNDLGFYMWGLCLSVTTGVTVRNIVHSEASLLLLAELAIAALVVCVVQFALGKMVGARYGCTIDAGQALGQKNTAFAIWITYTYLNPVASVSAGCYVLWQNIVNSVQLWWYLRRKPSR